MSDMCDLCREYGIEDCVHCSHGNPCYGCKDYDEETNRCKNKGGCGNGRMDKC